jgi:hypothetical protein
MLKSPSAKRAKRQSFHKRQACLKHRNPGTTHSDSDHPLPEDVMGAGGDVVLQARSDRRMIQR